MSWDDLSARIHQHRIMAILRGVPPEHAQRLVQALYAGGIRLLEVSLSGPQALESLALIAANRPPDVRVGAGTVVSAKQAEQAIGAGATFFVTPHVAQEVNAYAAARQVPVLGGAMTPTEIAVARSQGCRIVKVFPAAILGSGYVRSLLGPYPDLELLAVGGINAQNLDEYLAGGAVGAGIGGALTNLDWTCPDWDQASRTAADLTAIAAQHSVD